VTQNLYIFIPSNHSVVCEFTTVTTTIISWFLFFSLVFGVAKLNRPARAGNEPVLIESDANVRWVRIGAHGPELYGFMEVYYTPMAISPDNIFPFDMRLE
jgi:hypothetical protein